MDFRQATEIVLARVKNVEPELANKIMGYILLRQYSDGEMIRLAYGPDCLIASLVNETKAMFHALNSSPRSPIGPYAPLLNDFHNKLLSYPPLSPRPISNPTPIRIPLPCYWDCPISPDQYMPLQQMNFSPPSYFNPSEQLPMCLTGRASLEDNSDVGNSTRLDFLEDHCSPQEPMLSFPEATFRVCHYYMKGYCKHGPNCRFYHGPTSSDSISQVSKSCVNDMAGENNAIPPCSLEKLEAEIVDLLKSHRGQCISIAMLPLMYAERYGKHLQAEGYLTESQRHGKAGYSLTKLLARLKNSIRIIDRPHGQHAVMLAEDVVNRPEFWSPPTGSQQIYLTFPPHSAFTDEDVFKYFSKFGPVQAVRIPAQDQRMFGFVTFVSPVTAKLVLSSGIQHIICGARVLAKAYQEKKGFESKCGKNMETSMHMNQISTHHPSPQLGFHNRFHSTPREFDSAVGRQLVDDEQERSLNFQMMRLSNLRLAPRQLSSYQKFCFDFNEGNHSEDGCEIPSPEYQGSQHDGAESSMVGEDKSSSCDDDSNHESSSSLDLPENLFA